MQSRFLSKKSRILKQLDATSDAYHDLSPKGSVDKPIRGLIDDINHIDGLVTTSSCSGRISVFLEGQKKDTSKIVKLTQEENSLAGPGGKGGGGSWLFISHSPVHLATHSSLMSLFRINPSSNPLSSIPSTDCRYIHLKFEPMILHILASCLDDAQKVLTAAMSAGFRESGALSLTPSKTGEINPMVAVRSTGYSYDTIIGYQNAEGSNSAIIDEVYLQTLTNIANERFEVNQERIGRFSSALKEQYEERDGRNVSEPAMPSTNIKPEWEDAETRKQRKREEGLRRQQALQMQNTEDPQIQLVKNDDDDLVELNGMFE